MRSTLNNSPGTDAQKRSRDALRVLRRHWGHDGFRPGQLEIISAVLERRDVLAILPTGGGKSVCYQVPAAISKGLTVVVSPLIALMQDQVGGLNARGIPGAFINSTLGSREIEQRLTDAEFGKYRLLYVAPERLQSELFVARMERLKVSLLAVDEAHCISEWGHNFRPSYLQIAEARTLMGSPPTIAVTATATPEVRRDIIQHLELRDPYVVVKGFDRPNIVWSVFRLENKREKVIEIVRRVPGTGILYGATRRHVVEWAEWLRSKNIPAAAYHGGMPPDERERVQEAWLTGKLRVIAATNAFGMGIDKPDVRFVIHVDVPGTVEAYYQEAGRGGRDGRRSHAVLLFQPADENIQRRLIEDGNPDPDFVQAVYNAVCDVAQIPMGEQPEDRVYVDLEVVSRVVENFLPKVVTTLNVVERAGYWQVIPSATEFGQLRFSPSAEEVRNFAGRTSNRALAKFVMVLMRRLPGDAFSSWADVDLRRMARYTRLSPERLDRGLHYLQQAGILSWRPPGTATQLQFLTPRVSRLAIHPGPLEAIRKRAGRRLDDMLRYAQSLTCRRQYLLSYFGESAPERCGRCDVCLGRHEPQVITKDDEPAVRSILGFALREEPMDAWQTEASLPRDRVDELVAWLLTHQHVRVKDPLAGVLELTEKGRRYV